MLNKLRLWLEGVGGIICLILSFVMIADTPKQIDGWMLGTVGSILLILAFAGDKL